MWMADTSCTGDGFGGFLVTLQAIASEIRYAYPRRQFSRREYSVLNLFNEWWIDAKTFCDVLG
jgi:hypothetical protein